MEKLNLHTQSTSTLFRRGLLMATAMIAASTLPLPLRASESLEEAFRNPPERAKPIIIWQWMNGVVSKEGITADLESFKKIGLGGVQNFQVGGWNQAIATDPSIEIGNEKWKELIAFAIEECARLDLTFATHNCPGWSSSASPQVRVEDSMQKLVWTETRVSGFDPQAIALDQPEVDPTWNYYRDIAVVAVPNLPEIPLEAVVNLTDKMLPSGELHWQIPAGEWIILRFGYTTNGKTNENTAPESGVGLECDKMSRSAVEHYWSTYPSMLLEIAGSRAGSTFNRMEIDSYEAGPQSWTPGMPDEFQQRRGYDLLPWLPVLAGKIIGDHIRTQRFQSDWDETIADLFADNYYLFMDELARRTPGMNLLVQPYGTGHGALFNTQTSSGGESLLSAEFWTRPNWGWDSIYQVTSAAHTLGKPLVYGEGFTTWPLSPWQDDPCSLKPIGDLAFARGVNKLMLHAAAQNPWPQVKPGMTFGKWGSHFSPGQTWWYNAGPEWIATLSRSQALLQRGQFVGDICMLQDPSNRPHFPEGFSGDACGTRAFLTRMTVKDGRLQMPDGMSYRLLVLPDTEKMTLPVALKIRDLVKEGAIILGPRPTQCPGLAHYPEGDEVVREIADTVWGSCDGIDVKTHTYGKGRVYWGVALEDVLREMQIEADVHISSEFDTPWIHRNDGATDFYFISNQETKPTVIAASFRITGKIPELWHPDSGKTETAAHWHSGDKRTDVLLELGPVDSVFVVFRHPTEETGPGLLKPTPPPTRSIGVTGAWEVFFSREPRCSRVYSARRPHFLE